MIGQAQKPMEEILEMLDGKEKLVLYGCGDALRVNPFGFDSPPLGAFCLQCFLIPRPLAAG